MERSTETTLLIAALEDEGKDWRSYSGRGMFGARCVAVEIDSLTELFELGQRLPDVALPSIDDMGRGFVIYWPRCKVEEKED